MTLLTWPKTSLSIHRVVIGTMQRQCVDIQRSDSDLQEGVTVFVFLEGLHNYGRNICQKRFKVRGDGNGAALQVVNGQSGQMFSIAEVLYRPSEVLRGIALQVSLYVAGQTLAQDLGSVLQIAPHGSILHVHLIVRSAERNQRDADDK